jgi:hypothetical protein
MLPACSTISAASMPLNVQLTKWVSSIVAPAKPATHITRGLDALRTFSIVTLRAMMFSDATPTRRPPLSRPDLIAMQSSPVSK